MKIDITIVSGRRPDLLRKTLNSFSSKIIDNFDIGNVFANIDPFLGEKNEELMCEKLLCSHFERVELFKPEARSFGAAVKRLWQQPESEIFLHLEDDWLAFYPVYPSDIFPKIGGRVVQVQLWSTRKAYLPYTYSYKASWRKTFGLKLLKKTHFDRPLFSTSPSFFDSKFAAQCAKMMNPAHDPEKQLYSGETKLTSFTKHYLNHPLVGPRKDPIIGDIGRQWLAEKGVHKKIEGGVSTWEM